MKSTKGYQIRGFPGGPSDKELTCQCRRCSFDPWVGKMPWRREWQPTPVFLPEEFLGQRSLAGYNPWGHKELDTTEQLTLSVQLFNNDPPSILNTEICQEGR